jgi:hypothetical protein
MGALAKFATSAATPATEPFAFISESMGKRQSIVERDGIKGTRSHMSLDTRLGNAPVDGTIVLEPTPEDLAIWFPRILGTAANGTSYVLAETIPDFFMVIDRVAKVFTYTKNWVDRATFTGSEGQPIRLSMDIVGTDETVGNSGTFPALTLAYTTPYMFSDMVLTLAGSARQVKEFTLVIDNHLNKERFFNSTTRQLAPSEDRTITLSCTVPYSVENVALYAQALAGAAGTLVLTNANYSTTFTFGILQVPYDTPNVAGKGEVMLTLNMIAKKVNTTMELAVTHDSTP